MPPFDVEKFITETGLQGQDAEDARRIAKANPKFGEGYMRQDEFDRRFNESKATLKQTEDALATRRAELDAEYGAMTEWKGKSEAELQKARDSVTSAEARVKAAEDAVAAAARDAGRDPQEYLRGLPAVKREEPKGPAVDDKKYVDADMLASATLGHLSSSEALLHIDNEHRELFGRPLPKDANIVGEWTAALKRGERVTLNDVYEKKFGVAARRTELSQQQRQKEVDDAVSAALTKERTDRALRGGSDVHGDGKPQSPVLAEAFERTQARRPGAGGLEAAVSMYQTEQQKIRQQQAGS